MEKARLFKCFGRMSDGSSRNATPPPQHPPVAVDKFRFILSIFPALKLRYFKFKDLPLHVSKPLARPGEWPAAHAPPRAALLLRRAVPTRLIWKARLTLPAARPRSVSACLGRHPEAPRSDPRGTWHSAKGFLAPRASRAYLLGTFLARV